MNRQKLKAILFSMDNCRFVRDWADRNQDLFDVDMPPGLAVAPLTRVIYEPELLNSAGDGILIANHYGHTRDQIAQVCRILGQRGKRLYAVTNGVEPLGRQKGIASSANYYIRKHSNSESLG